MPIDDDSCLQTPGGKAAGERREALGEAEEQMRLGFGGVQGKIAALVALVGLPVAASEEPGAEEPSWHVRAAVNVYLFGNQSEYVQPTVAVDHGVLHLEAGYNYEALMLGGILGDVCGATPVCAATARLRLQGTRKRHQELVVRVRES